MTREAFSGIMALLFVACGGAPPIVPRTRIQLPALPARNRYSMLSIQRKSVPGASGIGGPPAAPIIRLDGEPKE